MFKSPANDSIIFSWNLYKINRNKNISIESKQKYIKCLERIYKALIKELCICSNITTVNIKSFSLFQMNVWFKKKIKEPNIFNNFWIWCL